MGWLDKYDDEIIAQGGETIPLSREIPEITVYGKKKYLQELDKQQQKYLADMAKYKQDSTQWVRANQLYKDSLVLSTFKPVSYAGLPSKRDVNYTEAVRRMKSGRLEDSGIDKRLNKEQQLAFNSLLKENKTEPLIKNINLGTGVKGFPKYQEIWKHDGFTAPNYIPTTPTKPKSPSQVNYDPTYEKLRMRPLWATMAKKDSTAKIGTLNPLDPLYEKGFTYGEAQKFPEEIRKQYKLDYPIYESGGFIPKAQEGKKVKKSVIFAESPQYGGIHQRYGIYQDNLQLPTSLRSIRNRYEDLSRRSNDLELELQDYTQYLINYLKGYTGKDIYSLNSDNTYYARENGDGRTYSTEEFKDLPQFKKYRELQEELDAKYYTPLSIIYDEFINHPDNPVVEDKMVDNTFQVEGNKLKSWYKAKGEELDVIPIYGLQDTSKVNAALKDVDLQDVGIMGHSGRKMGGIPLEWWNDKLKDTEYRNCVLGSCYGDKLLPLLPDVKNIYHTTENQWYGVNPSADSLENALFSTQEETKIKPIKGRDYNISNKYKTGGNVSYTPEYVKKILPKFENTANNLGYHLDPRKIPTIGWGHRITKEELERKAIKMGKEWVPYERFSGKEGRQLADKLMEQDVSHHYNRLERQVGKDTLNTLPPEVQDVLLDITYNRGSLGDSLEYVKKGDIAGLRDYLAETSKELKGGAKTRMEWRANRIPLKTLPPVETPIEYNTKDQYVPEVLRSIAEQPSTQSIIPIQDNEGYRNQENYGKPVQITSNESRTPISMDQVPFPILAMSDTGELKIMMPGEEHTFEGGSVTELPMANTGANVQMKNQLVNLDQLTNFTNYNKKMKHGGWLLKYKEQ